MALNIFLIFSFILFSLLIVPITLCGFGKGLKAQGVSLKKSFIAYLYILGVTAFTKLLSFISSYVFNLEHVIIELALGLVVFFLAVWIVKEAFDTTTKKSFGIYLLTVISTLLIAGSIKAFALQAFKIPSGAMEPTLQIGDHLLVNKIIYWSSDPKAGDIVVFPYPKNPSSYFIKRVVATEGSRVEIKDKTLYINGEKVDEEYVTHLDPNTITGDINPRDNFGPFAVPENSVFVMGDNRDNSHDSRFWGTVNKESVLGKAFCFYWSWDKENGKVRWSRVGQSIK